jgi:selenocysteine-specific translation elongation factor
MSGGKERDPVALPAGGVEVDARTVTTVQESRWLAGVNRQMQPTANLHQRAASQAAAAKRKAEAMSEAEAKQRKADHKKEVRAQQKTERVAAAAAAAAATAAARVPDRRQLNRWLKAEGQDRCDADEWGAFESFVCDQHGVSELAEFDDEDLEQVSSRLRRQPSLLSTAVPLQSVV